MPPRVAFSVSPFDIVFYVMVPVCLRLGQQSAAWRNQADCLISRHRRIDQSQNEPAELSLIKKSIQSSIQSAVVLATQ